MHSPLARRPEAGGASPPVGPVSPANSTAAAEYLLPVGWRGISAQAAAALGMLTGLWVAISPWFIMLQYRGVNATVTDVIAGLAVAAVGAAALASPRGYPGLQLGTLLLGAWLVISPFVLDEKFPIAHPMYWSNSWSGGVLMALALAGLAVLLRPAR
jgi:hypothetical protein